VDVVGPAVEEHYRRAIHGAGFDIANVEDAGIDLLGGPNAVSADLSDVVADKGSPA
jgi:hypothetical protein